jgi:hypothetical protein
MRNVFTNLPMEFMIPKDTDYVFVADFFANDIQGGAELTTEALVKKKPADKTVFKLHSNSLTSELVEKNTDKTFVLFNFVTCSTEALESLISSGVSYSVVEYDYKYCKFRSEGLHIMQTKKPCDCVSNNEIKSLIVRLYNSAKNLFWMSEAQKEFFHKKVPELSQVNEHVLSSCFDDETIKYLNSLYKVFGNPAFNKKEKIAILSKDNATWIKGIDNTVAFLSVEGLEYEHLPKLPYNEFLKLLAQYKKFCFRPADKDTCPRIVIEAKALGLEVMMNKNVQHKDEAWFKGTREEMLEYIKGRPQFFWDKLS